MLRVARIARIAHEECMQDRPVEVSDPVRLDEFVDLLIAHKSDGELSFWLLDLVLESANDDLPERTEPLIDALVTVWEATHAPGIAQRPEYWACPDASNPEEMFSVSPLVREARQRISQETFLTGAGKRTLTGTTAEPSTLFSAQ